MAELTFYPPEELREQLRIHAFLTKKPISDTVTRAVEAWLDTTGLDEIVEAAVVAAIRQYAEALERLGEDD